MDILQSIKGWFQQAVPEPTDKNRCVQIGCHFEEVTEMMHALAFVCFDVSNAADAYKKVYDQEAGFWLNDLDKNDLADSLADQIVTAIGVAHMFGIDIEGALKEVSRSNYSKFVDGKPIFDENGKIKKPDTYSPPDLTPFI